jgi:hypothetical protein
MVCILILFRLHEEVSNIKKNTRYVSNHGWSTSKHMAIYVKTTYLRKLNSKLLQDWCVLEKANQCIVVSSQTPVIEKHVRKSTLPSLCKPNYSRLSQSRDSVGEVENRWQGMIESITRVPFLNQDCSRL